MVGPDMRVLGQSDGLPALPDVTYYLWVRSNSANPLVRQAYAMVRASAGA
jgi:hypothetical protein